MLKHEWLSNALKNLNNNIATENAEQKFEETTELIDLEDYKKLQNEINISLTNKSKNIPNMVNTNMTVKVTNTSSAMCMIS